jgi:hypothetical protein
MGGLGGGVGGAAPRATGCCCAGQLAQLAHSRRQPVCGYVIRFHAHDTYFCVLVLEIRGNSISQIRGNSISHLGRILHRIIIIDLCAKHPQNINDVIKPTVAFSTSVTPSASSSLLTHASIPGLLHRPLLSHFHPGHWQHSFIPASRPSAPIPPLYPLERSLSSPSLSRVGVAAPLPSIGSGGGARTPALHWLRRRRRLRRRYGQRRSRRRRQHEGADG